jgi:hypothetical protein
MPVKERIADRVRGSRPEKFLKKRSRGRGTSARNYTYSIEIPDCPGTPSRFTYVLRGDGGSYAEDYCGDVLTGTLAYVTDVRITFEDFELSGHAYNGTDAAGEWGYFFGTDDLTGAGEYLVMLAEPYQAGDPPPWDPQYGALATRTEP